MNLLMLLPAAVKAQQPVAEPFSPGQTVAGPLATELAEFDRYFNQQMKEHAIPGAAYAVVYQNKIISAKGYGVRDIDGDKPVDPYTVFRIASVSKTFAAGLASLLEERGHFRWDESVVQYIPEFSFKNARYNPQLKIEHLLSQSSGVMPNAYDNLIEANILPERILPQFQKIDPLCNPGQCYGYQNVLFSLIEPIISQTTSSDYASLLKKNIFEPLQLPTASVGLEAYLLNENRASPHIRARGRWHSRNVNQSYYRFAPAAGVNASVIDLSHWLIAQLGYYPQVMPQKVLDKIIEKRVKTPRDLRRAQWRNYIKDAHYALGWRVYQFGSEQLIYHGGWVQGFRAELAYSRERELGLVILLNAESNVVNKLSTTFWASMFSALEQQDNARVATCKATAADQSRC
ncbi:serine hydrolase domain-containing protein [Arsukibacterium sp.]|uniref:serine hydrolase domain-containing protein n=1 Tax=Arsukibacterium sp. TaxID=1977258 RepID=UPI00299D1236|nr:serine hydrolase domain-containing protein [Arsukibacterium sp.]MDX1679037.1 serine hydrolase domain-containing protein [Arsukibacterium sp.]